MTSIDNNFLPKPYSKYIMKNTNNINFYILKIIILNILNKKCLIVSKKRKNSTLINHY